jgi:hypothetical protein
MARFNGIRYTGAVAACGSEVQMRIGLVRRGAALVTGVVLAGACSSDQGESENATGGAGGTGGLDAVGGVMNAGGAPSTGGVSTAGGTQGLGGITGAGGTPGSGGELGMGGDFGTGGNVATGGAIGSGGGPGLGGVTGAGGIPGSGGELGSGGDPGTGGDVGSGGDPALGGTGGGGPVDCTFVPDPSLAVGETGAAVGATAAHNEWRVRVGVPRVRWNTELAAGAQAYADTCPSGHSTYDYRADTGGFALVGENLYGGSNVLAGIAAFVAERTEYDFGTMITESNYLSFGHYTQVVWADTTDIGCAVGDCGTYPTVCWYGPTGNYTGETPYDDSEGQCLDLDNDDVFQFEDADDTNRDVQ